jgi:hypothetical protein
MSRTKSNISSNLSKLTNKIIIEIIFCEFTVEILWYITYFNQSTENINGYSRRDAIEINFSSVLV